MQIHIKLTLQFILLAVILLLLSLVFFYSKFYDQVINEQITSLRSQSSNISGRVLSYPYNTDMRDTSKNTVDVFNVKSNVILYDLHFNRIFSLNSSYWELTPSDISDLMNGKEVCSSSY